MKKKGIIVGATLLFLIFVIAGTSIILASSEEGSLKVENPNNKTEEKGNTVVEFKEDDPMLEMRTLSINIKKGLEEQGWVIGENGDIENFNIIYSRVEKSINIKTKLDGSNPNDILLINNLEDDIKNILKNSMEQIPNANTYKIYIKDKNGIL